MVRPASWKPQLDDPEILEYLEAAAGPAGVDMMRFILEREPITGEEILEAHDDEKPSAVRKILYALMQEHALEYHRDTDTKGWETFVWQTDLPEIRLVLMRRWEEELQTLRKETKFLADHEFYACAHDHDPVVFEDAIDMEFLCPVCGEAMQPKPIDDVKDALKERIDELAAALEG